MERLYLTCGVRRFRRSSLLQPDAWASLKNVHPTVNVHDECRCNDTHESTTDAEARLYRKGQGRAAALAYRGHALLDKRHGFRANVCVTAATGAAEREATAWMLKASAALGSTVGADEGHDTARFVDEVRSLDVAPRIARKGPYSAVDVRTTLDAGY